MKQITIFLTAILISLSIMAQSPAGINYQTVVRDGDGNILSDTQISLQLSILDDAPDGELVYQEIHDATTNAFGLVNLVIGNGIPQTGAFASILWGNGEKYLETAVDIDSSGNYTILGVTQFLSVPYSLFAANGMQSMSLEERDALQNPPIGMQIYNTTSNCLNYYSGTSWFETCGDCTPLPSIALAGSDQLDITESSVILDANTPEFGEGQWSILNGEDGELSDATDPNSIFSGQPDILYSLQWQIHTPCDTTYDTVEVSFLSEPQVFEVGEEYEGGIIAYILQPGDPGYVEGSINGLIAAPNDQESGEFEWGCYGTAIAGADGTAIGTGYQNTQDIVAGCSQSNIAARVCNDLVISGYDDWYLPSKDELYKLFLNKNLIGGFDNAYYWSSSETSNMNAWSLFFLGGFLNYDKYVDFNVRAIRSFSYTDTISPELPSNPNPADGSTNQELTPEFSWECSSPQGYALTYDIYLGTENPPVLLASGVSQTIFVTDTLESATQYFWKVVANDDQGNSTVGDVWNFTTAQTIENLEVGDEFQGGIIAYILQPGDPGYIEGMAKGLIAAPNDYAVNLHWGCQGTSIGTSAALGSGAENTAAIVAGCSQDGIAAKICDDYELNGYDDWCLPSKEELNKLFINKDLIGGFSTESYWCSTEFSDIRAYKQAFSSGSFSSYLKTFEYYVRPIRSFSYSGVYAPEVPSNPNPVDNTIDEELLTDLSWTCSDPQGDAVMYDVYFGIEPNPPLVASGLTNNQYYPDTLVQYTQYYWKIVARDSQGNTSEGPVWTFTTLVVNLPPDIPSTPSPENGATDQELTVTLSWTCADYDNDTLNYDVYFGTENDLQLLISGLTENSYTVESLQQYTDFYWKIVAHDSYGNTTEGEVWNFRTIQTEILMEVGYPFEGGIIAYILQPGDPGYDESTTKGFIAAESDQGDEEWGCYYNVISGADGEDLGTGYQNTLDIVDGCSYSDIAAGICNDLELNGYDDWYLPSIGELAKLYINKDEIGGFANDDYWSSTQADLIPEEFARSMDFANGNSNDFSYKFENKQVRAIRSFNYSGPTSLVSPSNPMPEHGSVNSPITCILSWNCPAPAGSSLSFDVFFGTESTPPLVATNYIETTYSTDTLEVGTQYFWKIVVHDDQGNSAESEVWNFTTAEANTWQCGLPFVDFRDGHIYETVNIDDQCWMTENLAYLPAVSPPTEGSESIPYYYVQSYQGTNVSGAMSTDNYQNYGVLYNWQASIDACPDGWNLPSNTQWAALTEYLEGENVAGGKMKSSRTAPEPHPRWDSPNIGADNSSGFSGLPGGGRNNNAFENIGAIGFWWTSTESSATKAWYRHASNSSTQLYENSFTKGAGFSVRCIMDINPQNPAPAQPSNPSPANGSTNQELAPELEWDCSSPLGYPLTFDLYLGTENTPALIASGLTFTSHYSDTLNQNTQYFWKVVAHDNQGNSTEGEVWNFTTMDSPGFSCGASFIDGRDGQSYSTVQIGNQCWMAENLNVGVRIDGSVEMTDNGNIEKYCFENNQNNCNTYGGMYQWGEMMEYSTNENTRGICPEGWLMPSDSIWNELVNHLGGNVEAGGKMKEAGLEHWLSPNTGATNSSGFTALPGGGMYSPNAYYELGTHGNFWSSSEENTSNAYVYILLNYDSQIGSTYDYKTRGFSVRCIKNEEI